LKVLFTKDERIARIEQYHRRIATAVTSFQESHHILLCLTIDVNGANRYLHCSTLMLGRQGMTMQGLRINEN
jgi:hypothetical protein